MSQPPWLEGAWTELGVREVRGPAHNPRISAFFRDAGHPDILADETAWCAAFVGACLERTGYRGSRSLLARSYLGWGEPVERFQLGSVAVLTRGSNPAEGHVGFLIGVTDDKLLLLGGNQSDAVTVEAYDRSRLLGLRWPGERNAQGAVAARPDVMFERALEHVLEMEGGWSEDLYDPGGPTNQGITLAVYAASKGMKLDASNSAALKAELRQIPADTVREIYRTRYWQPSRSGDLTAAVALMHFDASVNHGVGAAARMLQESCGATVDGEIGPETLGAVRAMPPLQLVARYADRRRARYRALSHFWRFGRGWLRRVDITFERASLLVGDGGHAGHQRSNSQQKGSEAMSIDPITPTPPKWWGQSMTIWGALITALATVAPAVGPVVGVDISSEAIRQVGGQAAQAVQAIAGLFGTVLTIWGRARAAQPLQRDIMFKL